MGKAGDRRRTLAKKAERARRRQAEQSAPQPDVTLGSGVAPANPSPALPAQTDASSSPISDTLPETTAQHGLQSSEQDGQGSEDGTSAVASTIGGSGVRPDRDPCQWANIRPRIRDTRRIRMLLRRKDWKVPDALHAVAPQQLVNIMLQRDIDGSQLTEDKRYTAGHRVAAIKTLQEMLRDNDRRLVAAVRLSQLDRRTAIMEEHPEVLGPGNTTNNVVIYLPAEAPMEKYAVDPSQVIDAKPEGNGNGRPKA